jgi:NADP-dependent 3-hydroxy acid dehydrogenase YdfG
MERSNRQALVVGASTPGGLGAETARRLAREGFYEALAGRRQDALAALANEIGARMVPCDILYEDSIVAMIGAAGTFDVLVNAASTTLGQSILNLRRQQI